MRARDLGPLVFIAALAACGGAKKDADNPGNTETADNGEGGAGEGGALGGAASDDSTGSGPAVPGDDAQKKTSPCGGFEIADLASVLGQTSCEVPNAKETDEKDMKDVLEIKVVPDSPRIAPGASSTITVTFKNKGKADLPLDFTVDPEPRFDFEVYTLKGVRVDKPKGDEPSLPSEVADAPQPEPKIARVTLATQGTAKLTLTWNAVKYKWASADRAKGALPGHGYPREPAGPLKKGAYILRVITPLVGVFEGVDHEVSQPRVQITVGSIP
jgi:hypothetical protein